MPEFNYKAVPANGSLLEGHREAENVKRLTVLLAQDGLELVDSRLRDKSAAKRHSRLKMKTAELANLIFQIGIQLRAGVSIVEALKSREGEDASRAQTGVRQRVSEIVEQGTPLSQGLEEFPRVFPVYIRNIVQVAERCGSLDENFIELRVYLEWMDQYWNAF